MTYFADLTPHSYTDSCGLEVLNVGWLDAAFPFPRGATAFEFRDALRRLCEQPIYLHRGFHTCEFCQTEARSSQSRATGNGQIRIQGPDRRWYAAPTLVHHYVAAHQYLPPAAFIDAVLRPLAIAEDER
jgi:hypothetical protein